MTWRASSPTASCSSAACCATRASRWRHKLLLGALVGYLAMPFDIVPDFIPVAGHLDDVLVVSFTLRAVLKGTRGDLLREHWPGPASSLALLAGHA